MARPISPILLLWLAACTAETEALDAAPGDAVPGDSGPDTGPGIDATIDAGADTGVGLDAQPIDGSVDAEPGDGDPGDGWAADVEAADAFAADAGTVCGPSGLVCDPTGEICVGREAGPGIVFSCQRVPTACLADRRCSCLGDDLCGGSPFICVDDGAPNTIRCECPVCQ